MNEKFIKIIYASTSGNVEVTAETISELLKTAGIESSLQRAEKTSVKEIADHDLFIMMTSTWEHGEFNPFFNRLYKEMEGQDFSGKSSGFFGLGDIRYEPVYFGEGIEIIKRRFTENGGKEIHKTVKLNGDPYDFLDTVVAQWTELFIKALQNDK